MTYLIEARWYSPTSYEIYHYGLAEVEADSSAEAYEKAAEVFKRHGKSMKLGPEPVSFRIVGPGHQYGKGYDPRIDKTLKENPMNIANPLSLRGKEAIIGLGLAAGVGAAIYYYTRPAVAAATSTTPPAVTPATITLQPGVLAQSATVPAGGLVVTLPVGGTWGQSLGSAVLANNTILIAPGTPGQTQVENLPWTFSGKAQTTALTITT